MPILQIKNLHKKFTLHAQNGAVLNVLNGINLQVKAGEIAALCGPSGAGKSSLLKAIYGTYRIDGGDIKVKTTKQTINIAKAEPRQIMNLRRDVIGYVSQFLRVIPRIGALDIVAEPAIMQGMSPDQAHSIALDLLDQLRIPQKLHNLSPLTFSGGEQQRVNIARAMAAPRPLMLFDEPTASLDPQNRQTVLELIAQLRDQGTAILGIFHDPADRKFLHARDIHLSAVKEAEHV
ncbi:MAG: phosphonate C-P lyase system protein PhnL [Alphaproteobacteria bacterium]|nr:phosphonate C-P lyase system protein PhnL [Alphaproteobacteria bacterium]